MRRTQDSPGSGASEYTPSCSDQLGQSTDLSASDLARDTSATAQGVPAETVNGLVKPQPMSVARRSGCPNRTVQRSV